MACIAEKHGDDAEAIDLYLVSFEFDTTHLPTLQGMASALFRAEKWNNARRILQIIIIQHRDALTKEESANAYHQLGEIHRHLDQLDRASDCFKKALELDKKHVPALRASSEMAILREDWDEAFETRELLYGLTGGDEVESPIKRTRRWPRSWAIRCARSTSSAARASSVPAMSACSAP